jgi:transposase
LRAKLAGFKVAGPLSLYSTFSCSNSQATFPIRCAILAYDGQGFWLASKRLSKGRFRWWPTGTEPTQKLRAHQAQLLLAAGNPDAEAPPAWRPLNA